MMLDESMKKALAEGLAGDPGAKGAGVVAGFLAGLPTGLAAGERYHWREALVAIRHLGFSQEYSAPAMRVLSTAGESSFGGAVAAAGGPASREWAGVLGEVRATRLDRNDLVIAHRAFIASAPGYGDGAIAAADVGLVADTLLLGDADVKALINHSADAVTPGRPLRVDTTPAGGNDVEPGRREARLWQNFDAFAGANPEVTCLAELLRPGYREQNPGSIDGVPVSANMVKEAEASLGNRYRTSSAAPAKDVLTALHQAQRDHPLQDLVTRHTQHLIVSSRRPEEMRAQVRARGGVYEEVAQSATRRDLVLPEGTGHTGALRIAERTVIVADGGAEKAAMGTLAVVCGIASLLFLAQGFTAFLGGLLGTCIAIGCFRWADRTRHYAGAVFVFMFVGHFLPGVGDGLSVVLLIALVIGIGAKIAARVAGGSRDGQDEKEMTS